MRARTVLLLWGGIALLWLAVAVIPWGSPAGGSDETLLRLARRAGDVPGATEATFPQPLFYLAGAHLVPLVATSALAVFLPLRARVLRVVVGVLLLVGAAGLVYEARNGVVDVSVVRDLPAEVLYVAAGVLAVAALLFVVGHAWLVGGLAGLVGVAGAIWTAHVVITQLRDGGGVSVGGVALTVGYLLTAAGAFLAFSARGRTRGR